MWCGPGSVFLKSPGREWVGRRITLVRHYESNFVLTIDDADEAHAAAFDRRDDPHVIFRIQTLRGFALLTLGRFHESHLVLREAQLLCEQARARPMLRDPASASFPLRAPGLASAEINTYLADALAFTGRADDAIDLLNQTVHSHADPAAVYTRLARLHERRGDFITAAAHWLAAGEEYAPLADPRRRSDLALKS